MRVLLIEDDQRLTRLIKRVLEEEHFSVDVAHDGETGLEFALRGVHDVAIADWMLPGRDGPAICRTIRAARLPIAILLLTARGQLEDRVTGLDGGAGLGLAIAQALVQAHHGQISIESQPGKGTRVSLLLPLAG